MTKDKGIERRLVLTGLMGVAATATSPLRAAGRFGTSVNMAAYRRFLASVQQEAIDSGLPAALVTNALSLAKMPNQDVLKLDQHQPEFTLTWAQYRDRVITSARCEQGRGIYQRVKSVMDPITASKGADSSTVIGIWGLESGFGAKQGKFNVIEALATLAFDERRKAFFRTELLKALKILATGSIAPKSMLGSYAGAMGQAQFMPSAYLRYGADGDGDGKCDIWHSQPDVFASIANYLGGSGWHRGESWGEEVSVPLGERGHFVNIAASQFRHAVERSIEEWQTLGVRPMQGNSFSAPNGTGRLVQPDGPGGQAFLLYRNFKAIRAYNPSDYYALAVGIVGGRIVRSPA